MRKFLTLGSAAVLAVLVAAPASAHHAEDLAVGHDESVAVASDVRPEVIIVDPAELPVGQTPIPEQTDLPDPLNAPVPAAAPPGDEVIIVDPAELPVGQTPVPEQSGLPAGAADPVNGPVVGVPPVASPPLPASAAVPVQPTAPAVVAPLPADSETATEEPTTRPTPAAPGVQGPVQSEGAAPPGLDTYDPVRVTSASTALTGAEPNVGGRSVLGDATPGSSAAPTSSSPAATLPVGMEIMGLAGLGLLGLWAARLRRAESVD